MDENANRLLHMLTHDIYHAGQIQYLRALQQVPADRSFYAAWDGNVAVLLEMLEEHPELLNAFDRNGWTALQIAAYRGQDAALRLVLDRGADVNAISRNDLATTALKSALHAGHQAVADLLRRHGARE